ncbi:heat shock protein 67B1 [Drosophila eugracilis]|uniref:heat shock protein 67B1 n=1 Tax=Drosophila eugracilis TaxID=29029 RepID=UPI0007E6BEC1|nr:heat shock protein 67B1 [Drosophila eugracilis]
MSLIPFILDLAEELHDFNRSLAMDIDDSAGFGLYPLDATSQLHTPQMNRGLGRGNAMMWVPIKGQSTVQHRHHPYNRVAGAKTVCCNKSLLELEKELGDKGTSGGSGNASQPTASKSAYSVVNRNGFQVSMNVKQFAANELTVKTIDNCIVVEGQHDEKEDGHGVISRHFIRKYILPKGYDPNEVHSTLSSDGILTVKAPPPLPVAKGSLERHERIVDIQQISQQQKDAQPPKPAEAEQQSAASASASTTIPNPPTPTPTPNPSLSLSVTLAETNGNGQEETEMESSSEVAALSPSLSNEAAAAAAVAVETPSTAGTTSSANNGVAEPESMEVVAKNEEAAKGEEPTPNSVVASEGELKAEDANANEVAIASNNGNGAAITPEDVEMPLVKKPETPAEDSKEEKETVEKVDKLEEKGGEELAAVDAAILLAKNQGENGATVAKTEELAK